MEQYPKQLCHVQGCPLWEGAVGGSVLALPVPPKPAYLGFCLWIKGEGSRQRPGEAGSVMQGRDPLLGWEIGCRDARGCAVLWGHWLRVGGHCTKQRGFVLYSAGGWRVGGVLHGVQHSTGYGCCMVQGGHRMGLQCPALHRTAGGWGGGGCCRGWSCAAAFCMQRRCSALHRPEGGGVLGGRWRCCRAGRRRGELRGMKTPGATQHWGRLLGRRCRAPERMAREEDAQEEDARCPRWRGPWAGRGR